MKKALWWASRNIFMKAVDGFEPTIKLLQSRALPLGYTAITDTILSKKQRFVKSLSSNWLVIVQTAYLQET